MMAVKTRRLPVRHLGTYPCLAFGGGVIGNTPGSGPVIGGSSPPPRAGGSLSRLHMAPSSSGLGRRPLKAVAPVQIRSGLRVLALGEYVRGNPRLAGVSACAEHCAGRVSARSQGESRWVLGHAGDTNGCGDGVESGCRLVVEAVVHVHPGHGPLLHHPPG